jgi:uncharacterized protein with HEPN domain
MHPKSPKWLDDVLNAGRKIMRWTYSVDADEFQTNELLADAVERNFMVTGEALHRIERVDPGTAERIPEYRQIIGFRNRIAHRYDQIDHLQVWIFARQSVPSLLSRIEELLDEAEAQSS